MNENAPLFQSTRDRRKPPSRIRAFSLVEVILALSIAAFALVAMVALLPTGLRTSKDSLDETMALNILSQIIAERQAMPLTNATSIYHLPVLSLTMTPVTNVFGVLDESKYSGQPASSRFRVTCWFVPPATGTFGPYLGYFKVSWPGADASAANFVESVVTFAQP